MNSIEQKKAIYISALHATWDLQDAMPAECNPEYPAWLERWNAQQTATETTRNELAEVVGVANVAMIIFDEYHRRGK